MRLFKFFRTTHKWTGIILSIVFVYMSMTGFLLLIKKKSDWIQPSTQRGAEGEAGDFITLQRLFDVLWTQNHPDFASVKDIERVDFRPGKRVFKIHSEHHHAEIQVCAVTGKVLSVSWRLSDLLENIHDGSFFAAWFHNWIMPGVSAGLPFLVLSGWWIWLDPKVRKRRNKRRKRVETRQAVGTEAGLTESSVESTYTQSSPPI